MYACMYVCVYVRVEITPISYRSMIKRYYFDENRTFRFITFTAKSLLLGFVLLLWFTAKNIVTTKTRSSIIKFSNKM